MNIKIIDIVLKPTNNKRLNSLCGPCDDNLKQFEHQLSITISRQNNIFKLQGLSLSVDIAIKTLILLYENTISIHGAINDINPDQVSFAIQYIQALTQQPNYLTNIKNNFISIQMQITLKHRIIKPRTLNQARYIANIFNHDITFGIGPSGTGKTYLAIAIAIDLLERKKNQHIILSRPAIEAGEKLGFLPGDFNQKTDPYIRPLYDALGDVLGYKEMDQLIQKNTIEVIPLAYMRGRTLNNAIVILDESQNTTITQMKMFLTRIGFNSKAIITGDITQVDLPSYQESGLAHAIKILSVIKDISFNFFNKSDSVRHAIVTKIIDAYESCD
ncbi:phoH-like protein [Candidatus Blochmanniella vafra str. BVAF]|uniref:PhoH-like protein n=1 Tax=Blochmanniella vafra (strain BVAF) TaxID=859654 RepID=E8Q6X0_BLOVB|nr:PhoH family protein [Candidatus Blochmannia vafer]ADV33717.1 phoH-like protein [Candidatus Blochmannia vafer str. BVAF]